MADDLLTPEEAAGRLKISTRTLRRLARRGEIAVVRIGRAIRFRGQDIDAWIVRNVAAAMEAPSA